MSVVLCESCESLRAQLDLARKENAALRARLAQRDTALHELVANHREALKVIELQQADLTRYQNAVERMQPNVPERVSREQLQMAFVELLNTQPQLAAAVANDTALSAQDALDALGRAAAASGKSDKKPAGHGRRSNLDLSKLPSQRLVLDPPEVLASGGVGFVCIGEEVSSRVGFRRGGYLHILMVRRKWARLEEIMMARASCESIEENLSRETQQPILVAPVPDGVWPRVMADPSLIAHIAISKYGDSLPLHRQEVISARHGFHLPRSSQCDWLIAGLPFLRRLVDAMFLEARHTARYIATDATGAPVRAPGKCENWHLFVFVAERDHVIFRYGREHTSKTISSMLAGYHGFVVADAHIIYDTLYDDLGMTEVSCWVHARRYLWKALDSDRARALEALALVSKIFQSDRLTRAVPMPERTVQRADLARPYLDALEAWCERHQDSTPRERLAKAIGYMTNQREGLRRFLEDGGLPLHNNESERQLRAVVMGRANWGAFENETGLQLYATYRSLIASCGMHKLNAEIYLEQVLRLLPHWPVNRVIELAPKYWTQTLARLDASQRSIITPPWELDPRELAIVGSPPRVTKSSAA